MRRPEKSIIYIYIRQSPCRQDGPLHHRASASLLVTLPQLHHRARIYIYTDRHSTRFPTRFPLNAFNLPRGYTRPAHFHALSQIAHTIRRATSPTSATDPLQLVYTSVARPIGKSEILITSVTRRILIGFGFSREKDRWTTTVAGARSVERDFRDIECFPLQQSARNE